MTLFQVFLQRSDLGLELFDFLYMVSVVGTNTYGAGPLFGPAGSGGRMKSGSRRSTRAILPSFGALRRDNTPTAAL